MKLHELKPVAGARKSRIRRGRGDASGYGSFSGRGCKGQNARSGGGVRIGFEGGQTTLLQRMPKRKGFTNPKKVVHAPVNLTVLENTFLDGDTVSPKTLKEKGLVRNTAVVVKILSQGEISKELTFQDVIFSKAAQKKAERSGCIIGEMKKSTTSNEKIKKVKGAKLETQQDSMKENEE